jgi:histidine triad (HIT) family protein
LCQVLAGTLPGSFIYRDERVAAFLDIQPVNPGHTLVVPMRHATYLADLEVDEASALLQVALRAAAALRLSSLRCEGVNLFLADGEAAGQEVLHVHLHVLPRFAKDGFGLKLPPEYHTRHASREELDRQAGALRTLLPTAGPSRRAV